jgi:HEAT repeat protein
MRSTGLLRLGLIVCLGLTAAGTTGCENENDPKTWVGKLGTTNKRPGAMRRLRQMWESRLASTTPPNNLQDPGIVAFINDAIPTVAQSFIDHRDEIATRKEAIEILATARDPRAIPALLAALEFSPGNSESERIALRAAQALREMHPENNAEVTRRLMATIDRASSNSGSAPSIREAVIQALGAIRAREAVPVLVRVLKRPIDQQEIRTARAAADALGVIGDSGQEVVDALIYGLFLNVRRANAFNNCSRALVRLGPDAAVPRLLATVQNQNPEVTLLINSYANVPGMTAPPPGYQQATSIDVLRNFADARSIDPLLALLRDRQTPRRHPRRRGRSACVYGPRAARRRPAPRHHLRHHGHRGPRGHPRRRRRHGPVGGPGPRAPGRPPRRGRARAAAQRAAVSRGRHRGLPPRAPHAPGLRGAARVV